MARRAEEERPEEDDEDEDETEDAPEEEEDVAPESRPAVARVKPKKVRTIGARPKRARESRFENTDADLLWSEICDRCGKPGELESLTPEDIDIRVAPAEDTSRVVAWVNGGAVKGAIDATGGNEYPGAALRKWLIPIHCAYGPAPQKWAVMFVRRKGGHKTLTRGSISLASPQQIRAFERAQQANLSDVAQAAPEMPWPPAIAPPANGYGGPAQSHGAPPNGGGYPPNGYGPPYPGASPEIARLSADVARLSGGLEAVVNALRAGQVPPPVAAAPPTTAPTAPLSVEEMVERVFLRLYGSLPREPVAGAGVAAAPAAPAAPAQIIPAVQPPTPEMMASRMSSEVGALKTVMDSFRQFESMRGQLGRMLGVETPGAHELVDETPEPPAPAAPPPEPFITAELPLAKMRNGQPFIMARDAKTGAIHPWGTLLANPAILETAMDKIGPVIANVMERAAFLIPGVGGAPTGEAPGAASSGPGFAPAAAASPPANSQPNSAEGIQPTVPAGPRTGWPTV